MCCTPLSEAVSFPGPAQFGVPAAAYLNGLAEAASELRRSRWT